MNADIDLDINNYELTDILDLFKLNYNFNKEDLKKTKKMVLKSHPDKSGLDKEYFLFFTKAYKIIYSIYEFREHSSNNKNIDYDNSYLHSKEEEALLENFKNNPNFNKIFNELFEKHNLDKLTKSDGYGEWLKSEDDINTDKVSKKNMDSYINTKKKELSSLIPSNNVENMVISSYSNLVDDNNISNYSSDIFSSLPYEDLKKAHIESVIPVTEEDCKNKMNKTVESYKVERNNQDIKPMTENKARGYLEQKRNDEDKDDIDRLYRLAKDDEKMSIVRNNLMSTFKRLT